MAVVIHQLDVHVRLRDQPRGPVQARQPRTLRGPAGTRGTHHLVSSTSHPSRLLLLPAHPQRLPGLLLLLLSWCGVVLVFIIISLMKITLEESAFLCSGSLDGSVIMWHLTGAWAGATQPVTDYAVGGVTHMAEISRGACVILAPCEPAFGMLGGREGGREVLTNEARVVDGSGDGPAAGGGVQQRLPGAVAAAQPRPLLHRRLAEPRQGTAAAG